MEKELPVAKPGMTRKEFANKYSSGWPQKRGQFLADLDKVIQSEMAQPGETVYKLHEIKNEGMPKTAGHYLTNLGWLYFDGEVFLKAKDTVMKKGLYYWLEEITLPAQKIKNEQKICDALRFAGRNLNWLKENIPGHEANTINQRIQQRIGSMMEKIDEALNEFSLKHKDNE